MGQHNYTFCGLNKYAYVSYGFSINPMAKEELPLKPKVYIDGKEGTTGLQIYERLSARGDIDLLLIDEEKRKDTAEQKNAIIHAGRVANPGCHATGFLSIAAPLVKLGILPANYPMTVYSLTGYSGGGKKMIAQYEEDARDTEFDAPWIYGLNLRHKHLPEMQKIAGLEFPPVFNPVVDDYYKGMATTLMLHNRLLNGRPTAENIAEALAGFYAGQSLVSVVPFGGQEPMLSANKLAGKDTLEITVCGHEDQTMVTARFDNLGKGASGAAIQNMNLMLGFEETTGLDF